MPYNCSKQIILKCIYELCTLFVRFYPPYSHTHMHVRTHIINTSEKSWCTRPVGEHLIDIDSLEGAKFIGGVLLQGEK